MKTNKALYPTIIILLIFISFILFIWLLQQNKSLYVQIEKAILKLDTDYSELLLLHADNLNGYRYMQLNIKSTEEVR